MRSDIPWHAPFWPGYWNKTKAAPWTVSVPKSLYESNVPELETPGPGSKELLWDLSLLPNQSHQGTYGFIRAWGSDEISNTFLFYPNFGSTRDVFPVPYLGKYKVNYSVNSIVTDKGDTYVKIALSEKHIGMEIPNAGVTLLKNVVVITDKGCVYSTTEIDAGGTQELFRPDPVQTLNADDRSVYALAPIDRNYGNPIAVQVLIQPINQIDKSWLPHGPSLGGIQNPDI
jgi:hypothetical protein